MTAKTLRRAVRGLSVAMAALFLAALHPDRIRAQAAPMRWAGALEHVSANGWWGSTYAPHELSRHPVSEDGRWIVFKASIQLDPPQSYVFVRDRMMGETQILIGIIPAAQAPVVNGDGNHVAFQSCEPYMRQDQQPICDVYIVDRSMWR